jgi:TetR/AcrR family transcriptional repressor of nem operon
MLDRQTKPDTRARILAVAESAVLAKGFASTSIDEIVAAVGITKSGFFYISATRARSRRG